MSKYSSLTVVKSFLHGWPSRKAFSAQVSSFTEKRPYTAFRRAFSSRSQRIFTKTVGSSLINQHHARALSLSLSLSLALSLSRSLSLSLSLSLSFSRSRSLSLSLALSRSLYQARFTPSLLRLYAPRQARANCSSEESISHWRGHRCHL